MTPITSTAATIASVAAATPGTVATATEITIAVIIAITGNCYRTSFSLPLRHFNLDRCIIQCSELPRSLVRKHA